VGQGATLWSDLDTNTIRIGEQAHLKLQLRDLKGGEDVTWPEVKDTLSRHIEVIEAGYPEKASGKGRISMEMDIVITSWDSGHYAIRPMKVIVDGQELFSEAFLLNVQTMEVDTAKAPLDIKPILEEDFNFRDWLSENWPYVLGILAILAILILIFRMRRKGSGNIIPMAVAPAEDPTDVLLNKLKRMRDGKTYAQMERKAYYVELTDQIRDYLALRYQLPAHEYTSAEIMEALPTKGLSSSQIGSFRNLFLTSDMVKFAKGQPSEVMASEHLNESIHFIESTRFKDEPAEKK